MKFFLLSVICLLFLLPVTLGQNAPIAGQYRVNNTMGPFEGTWRYVNGIDTIQINLRVKKVFFNMNGGFYWDRLVGWHIYKRGQTVIESSYQFIDDVQKRSFLGGNEYNDEIIASGQLNDFAKNKFGHLDLKLDASVSPNQLIWKLENNEGLKYRKVGEPPYDFTFTLPQNMILIKH